MRIRIYSILAVIIMVACCMVLEAEAGKAKGLSKKGKGKGAVQSAANTADHAVKKAAKDAEDGTISHGTVSSTTSHVKNTVKKVLR